MIENLQVYGVEMDWGGGSKLLLCVENSSHFFAFQFSYPPAPNTSFVVDLQYVHNNDVLKKETLLDLPRYIHATKEIGAIAIVPVLGVL